MSWTPGPRHALMQLPPWFWGGNPTAFLAEAGVEVGRDPIDNQWAVQTVENHLRQAASLVAYKHIAGPGVHQQDFAHLSSRVDMAAHESDEWILAELRRKEERLQQTRNPVYALELIRLHTLISDTSSLGDVVEHHYRELLEVPLEDDPDSRVFTHAGVHLIERAPALTWRLKLPMILSQIGQDRKAQAGDIAHLLEVSAEKGQEGVAFRTAGGLSDGTYLMDTYLDPLLGALTPSIWCITVPRSFGAVLFSLGQPMAGNTGGAEEMLHLISGPGAERSLAVPHLSATASHSAVHWWSNALNQLFAVLSDFAVFTNRQGVYQPDKHLQAILTMEQLFRRTASATTADRDTNARRVLMFTALDTVERLTAVKLEKMASPKYASAVLERLRGEIWPGATEVLLPAAERSVEALRQLGDGFFVRRMLGDEELQLHYGNGAVNHLSQDEATAYYVKALRDATHGHGSNKAAARDRTTALLAQHDGRVSHDLGLLAMLYLLDLLAYPDRLRRVLHSWSAAT